MSFCIRHITHCSFCNQTIKKQDLETHIINAKGTIYDLVEEVKRGDFDKITDREAHGADLKELMDDESGNNLLHISVRTGNKEIVHYLLARGLDINQPNRYGETPLHFICGRTRDLDMVKLLVSKGADYKITNNLGESAICKIYSAQAQRNGDHEAALFFTNRNRPQLSVSISDGISRPETSSESKRLKPTERAIKRTSSRGQAQRVDQL